MSGRPSRPARAARPAGRDRTERWRRTAAAAVAALLATFLLPLVGNPAAATTAHLLGHDVSWPQCPAGSGMAIPGTSYGVGYGLPMPPTTTQFVVIGLTDGLPLHRNHCLADQVAFVRANNLPRGAYTMAAYPTSAQLAAYGSSGPMNAGTLAGRLYNVGYAMARFDLGSLAATGLAVPFVWIDVEPRPGAPTPPNWPLTSTANNRQVLLGIRAGFRAAGLGTGWYSTRSAWQAITGSWQDGDPMWKAGDYTGTGYAGALSICGTPSLNGGPIWMGQRVDGSYDLDATCLALPTFATIFGSIGAPSLSGFRMSSDWATAGTATVPVSLRFWATLGTYQAWTAQVLDQCSGRALRQWSGVAKGTVTTTWDGKDSTGALAPPGLYTLRYLSEGQVRSGSAELVRTGATRLAGCPLTRVFGADRYATAVAAGRAVFPQARTIVLAPGPDAALVDGLVSAPLARALQAPLLLTATTALSPAVEADVRAHAVTSAYVIGAAAGVSVRSRLAALGVTVHVVAGPDRYATSVAVARALAAAGGAVDHVAFVGSGLEASWIDSLAAGGPAAGRGEPVLLTRPTALPDVVRAEVARLGVQTTYVLGGTDVVSAAVAAQLPGAVRLSGADRYATALAVARTFATAGETELVSGQQAHIVDGLPAGVAGRPVLLTDGTTLTAAVRTWLASSPLSSGRILGGPTVVRAAATAALLAALPGTP
ncbi:MAG: cell wall-binding repeat-containing protein [Motilibacteraceae bacterium]